MTALELTALALVTRLICDRDDGSRVASPSIPQGPELVLSPVEGIPQDDDADLRSAPASHTQHDSGEVEALQTGDPVEFIREAADEEARYYRAADESGEVLAVFYGDGRVRLADEAHRFAGMVENGHADLLEIADNTWSELFVSVTPEGRLQLELRGGPFDTRVFTCESA